MVACICNAFEIRSYSYNYVRVRNLFFVSSSIGTGLEGAWKNNLYLIINEIGQILRSLLAIER